MMEVMALLAVPERSGVSGCNVRYLIAWLGDGI